MVYPVQDRHNSINSSPLYRAGDSPAGYELGVPLASDLGKGAMARSATPQDPDVARKQLIEAGRQFEAYFISYLLKVMRETVPQGAIVNTHGAYFHSFYDQEIGQRAAESGGIGITRMVQEHAEKYFVILPVEPSSSDR
jgi:flagellar protein FlgJ